MSKTNTHTVFDFLVFIGRFEPFHNGHLAVVERALKQAQKLIIIVGSAGGPRSIKNPWNADERAVMIRRSLPADAASRVLIGKVPDHPYNEDQWLRAVQHEVARLAAEAGGLGAVGASGEPRIGLVGHDKDATSYYLAMFPQWPRVDSADVGGLSATQIRDAFLDPDATPGHLMMVESAVPAAVYEFLVSFRATSACQQLQKEFEFVRTYKARWAVAPYAPTFVTADAVVAHSGHVLLVRRRAEPGRGLWAWPGGFVDQNELILDACIRELREETRLKLPAPVLRGSIKGQHVFDHPGRSSRGRTITHAFFFEFAAGPLPEVKASDDAEKARWIPMAEFYQMRDQMFEDHFHIGTYFLGA
jgi:bifunctional NMN adenylyltransferase/nudix hydrolase